MHSGRVLADLATLNKLRESTMIRFELPGASHEYDGEPAKPLLWYVRETAGLTGTKVGCGVAQCGACIVYIDGKPGPSCTTPCAGSQPAAQPR